MSDISLTVDMVDGRLTDDSAATDDVAAPKAPRVARSADQLIATSSAATLAARAQKMITDADAYDRAIKDMIARRDALRANAARFVDAAKAKLTDERAKIEARARKDAARLAALAALTDPPTSHN